MHRAARAATWLACLALPTAGAWELRDGPPGSIADPMHWHSYRTFSSNDGLPQNTVYALVQDRRGYLYAGTEAGLARYDAADWRALPLPENALTRAVGTLAVAADDALWVGTASGLWRRTATETRPLPAPSATITVYDLEADADVMWVAAADGLYRCTGPDACDRIEATRGLQIARVERGRGPVGDCLWLGVEDQGLLRIDFPVTRDSPLAAFRLTRDDGMPNHSVRSLREWGGAEGHDLWVGTGRGLVRYDGQRVVRYHAASGFPGGMVWALEPTTEHHAEPSLLVGVRPGGLAVMRDDGSWTLETVANGLAENFVSSLYRTRSGDGAALLWIGTVTSGIARSEPARWRRFDERDGLPDRVAIGIGSLASDGPARRVWLGTMRGAVQWRDGAWQPLLPPAFADRLVRDALVDARGTLWAATERGLLRVDAAGAYEYTRDNSELPAVGADLLALRPTGDGSEELWVGTGHGLGRWRARDDLQAVAMPLDERASVVTLAVTRAAGGAARAWVGRDDGLYVRDGDAWTPICAEHRLGTIVALLAAPIAAGEVLWVAGRLGLARVGAEAGATCVAVQMPAAPAGPPANVALALDEAGRLYVFGTAGVARLRFAANVAPSASPHPPLGPDAVLVPESVERYTLEDGLPSIEFHGGRSAWRDTQGRIWAASTAGLVAFDPAGEMRPAGPAPLELSALVTTGQDAPLAAGAELASSAADLRFEFRLLAYEREHLIRYRSELSGLERAPQPWTRVNSMAYSRLPPGRYEFRVWGRDAHGVVAGPATFAFRVAAPFWRRPWAYAAYALALIGLGLLAGRWRQRALERRALQLESEVDARTRELGEANQRLEEASLTDPLTGLRNRRYYALEIEREVERTLRRVQAGEAHADLVLALIDIDRFKAINDRAGHDAGDAVLVEIGRRLRAFKRAGDFALRWGGEEFLLILRDSDRSALPSLARRLLDLAAVEPVPTPSGAIAVTVSIGCAAFPLDPAEPRAQTFEQLLKLVDRALYRAKGAGRNCAYAVRWDVDAAGDERGWRLVWQRVDPTAT